MKDIVKLGIVTLGSFFPLYLIAGVNAYQKYLVETREFVSNPVLSCGNPRTLYSAEKPNERSFGLHNIGSVANEDIKIERFTRRPRFNPTRAEVVKDGLGNIKNMTLYLQEGIDFPEYCPVGR
jgi:hypothetical protein